VEIRLLRKCLLLLVASRYLLGVFAAEPPAAFGLTNVWTIELRVTRDAWSTILGSRTFTPADITVNGVTYTNVAVRQKGQGTTSGTGMGRPPLHLVLKGQRIAGVKKLSLNNNYFDTSYMRDVLSYKLCNDFGVAAPRTAFAKVYLRTSNASAARYLGLYTATEIVDEEFLQARFGTKNGFLMKPTLPTFMNHGYWPKEVNDLVAKTKPGAGETDKVLAFLKLINQGPQRAFKDEIGSFVDLDNFLRFAVLNVALANCDSYFSMGKNFYLYLNPATSHLTFIPWDFDLSFGGHFLFGTPEQRMNLTIDKPTDDRLFTRLLAIPEMKERYHALMREFVDKHFQVVVIEQQIDLVASLIESAVMDDSRDRGLRFKRSLDGRNRGLAGNGRQVDVGLKQFVEGRVASLNDQLAGKSKGVRPQFGAH
jgi:spore coat protein H